jgi:hypothetical protein
MHIGKITKTAFGHFFQGGLRGVGVNRYFALGDEAIVIGCVPRESDSKVDSPRPADGFPLFVGYMNGNPFAQHATEIQELATALGVEITSNHYPYRSAASDIDEEPSP